MPRTALAMYILFVSVAFFWRAWLQYRRTGDYGLRVKSAAIGSVDWLAGFAVLLGACVAALAPVGDLTGIVEPFAAVNAPWINWVGFLLELTGISITVKAQLDMRDSWRIGVDKEESTALITTGLFSLARNPIFSGVLLAATGLALMVPNVASIAGAVITFAGVEAQVRAVEEPYLIGAHGEDYLAYARRVGRFVPRLGRLPNPPPQRVS